jgi:predicted metal-dependent hydrolase
MNAEPLPEFSVRRSDRARRVRLIVNPRDGLVVVVPHGWRGNADEVVASRRVWVERALASVSERRALHLAGPDAWLPHEVELRALERILPVEYLERETARTSATIEEGSLVVVGAIGDPGECVEALRRWLARAAREYVTQRLGALAARHGVCPARVRISSARTRWGSCSARGTVSLNRNVLFLPPELADALMLHELAHLRVLDHSPRFWSALAAMDPHSIEHRAQLKGAGRHVPAWADV